MMRNLTRTLVLALLLALATPAVASAQGMMGDPTGAGMMGDPTGAPSMADGTGTPMMGDPTGAPSMANGTGTPMMGDPTGVPVMGGDSGGPMGMMFGDVPGDAWFTEHVEHMVGSGFMQGTGDGMFSPDQPMTRGQFAAIMARMMGLQPANGSSFSDMAGFWAADLVEAMAQKGVIRGHADGSFGPYHLVTRAQIAAMMDRAWEQMYGPVGGDPAAMRGPCSPGCKTSPAHGALSTSRA